jgi:predicted RNA binding protein YcfA (HicA-like mRNA interferase family)
MAKRRRYTQKELKRRLESEGWTERTGGKHVVKMVKRGERPITIPMYKGETLPIGLSQAILKQAGIEDEK